MGQLLAGPTAKFLGGQQAMAHPQRPPWMMCNRYYVLLRLIWVPCRRAVSHGSYMASSSKMLLRPPYSLQLHSSAAVYPTSCWTHAASTSTKPTTSLSIWCWPVATKASGQLYPTKSNRLSYLISPQRLIDISSIFSQPLFTQPLRLQLSPRMHVASSATDCPRRPSSSFLPTKQCELISRPLGRRLSWPWSPAA